MNGEQEQAKVLQDQFIKEYQDLGWVKHMRSVHNIREDVEIVPGMREAEEQSKRLNERDSAACTAPGAKEAAAAEQESDGDDSAGEDDDFPPFPKALKKKGQRYASISYILDKSDDMECLFFIHGIFGSFEEAIHTTTR